MWPALSRGLTCGWSVLDAFTSTTVISIVTDRHIAAILAGTVDLSKSTGNGWVSPPTSCPMKVLRSSPARTGCSDDPGIPDALRVGRRCLTTPCFAHPAGLGLTAIGSEDSDR